MLLDDIVELATDDKQPIAVLLRKCLILASQLKNERLKVWANLELNGYDADDTLPPYRVLTTLARGNFSGYAGRQLRGWQIPSMVLEEKHRRWATETPLIHPVSTYEELSRGSGDIQSPWSPDLVLYYQQKIPIQGYALISAWQDVPKSGIVGMLDTIRTRVLNMTLEIQKEVGETDADLKAITPQDAKKVDQTITTYIYGGNVIVSTGSSASNAINVRQQQNIQSGDWDHLSRVLQDSGLSNSDLEELSTVVEQDGNAMGARSKGLDWQDCPQGLEWWSKDRNGCGSNLTGGISEAIFRFQLNKGMPTPELPTALPAAVMAWRVAESIAS